METHTHAYTTSQHIPMYPEPCGPKPERERDSRANDGDRRGRSVVHPQSSWNQMQELLVDSGDRAFVFYASR